MPYVLGIDVGSCSTAAAIGYLGGARPGGVGLVRLGTRTGTIPSVLSLARDGSLVLGPQPAARRTAGARPRAGCPSSRSRCWAPP